MRTIPEKDWKQLRSIKTRVLDDACARILAGGESILQKREGRNHEAYLESGTCSIKKIGRLPPCSMT